MHIGMRSVGRYASLWIFELIAVDVTCCGRTAQVTRDADGAVLLSGDWHGVKGASLCGLLQGQPMFTLTMMDSFGDGTCV